MVLNEADKYFLLYLFLRRIKFGHLKNVKFEQQEVPQTFVAEDDVTWTSTQDVSFRLPTGCLFNTVKDTELMSFGYVFAQWDVLKPAVRLDCGPLEESQVCNSCNAVILPSQ